MKNINKNILFISIGEINRASSRFRVYWWKKILESEGYSVKIIPYYKSHVGKNKYANFLKRRLWILFQFRLKVKKLIKWSDVVVIQEVLISKKIIDIIKKNNSKIIYDFSDPIFLTENNINLLKKIIHNFFDIPKFKNIISNSDSFIIENENLISQLPLDKKVEIMRGPVNTNHFKPSTKNNYKNHINIGWTGSPGTFKYLVPLFPVFEKIQKKYKVKFIFIGAPNNFCNENFNYEVFEWSFEDEATIVSNFDIGLFNLMNDNWGKSRGGGKLLVYMASGVPVISACFGIGSQIVKDKYNGLLVKNEKEWFDALELLIINQDIRLKMSKNARNFAVKNCSHSAYLNSYLKLING